MIQLKIMPKQPKALLKVLIKGDTINSKNCIINVLIDKVAKSDSKTYIFYSKLKTRLESAETTEISVLQPALVRFAHGSFMVIVVAIAILMGIFLGQNDYRYLNNNKQVLKQTDKMIQNDYSIADEQFATNYFNF